MGTRPSMIGTLDEPRYLYNQETREKEYGGHGRLSLDVVFVVVGRLPEEL